MNGNRVEKKQSRLKTKESFMTGVAVLTASTLIVKLIGLLYKIPLIKYLGEDGMGYFNSAYEIYTLFYIIATAGFPVAISIMVAKSAGKERHKNAQRIFRVSLGVLFLAGILGTAVLFFGAERLGYIIGNSGAIMSVSAIAPMALFVCVSSALKGYFQGYQNMTPTAVSNVIEALGKLSLGLGLAAWAVRNGYGAVEAAAFATLGIAAGVGISTLYLMIAKLLSRQRKRVPSEEAPLQSKRDILKSLAKTAAPITLSSIVISITKVVDLVMILRRLQAIGYTEASANAIYGSYSTLAVSMFNLPASFVTPIALSLVPVLSAAIDTKNTKKETKTLNASLRLCGIITLPASLGMSVFSRPILELVFAGEKSAINTAAPLLSTLSLSVFFSSVITVTNAILQAYGKERKPIISMMLGALVKIVASYILIGIPQVNIYGAPISTLLCDVTVAAVNIAYIRRTSEYMYSAKKLFSRALASAVLSVGACGVGYYIIYKNSAINTSALLTLGFIALTMALFAVLAFKLKAIRESDILFLPKGDKICGFLKKIKLI